MLLSSPDPHIIKFLITCRSCKEDFYFYGCKPVRICKECAINETSNA